jgi:iron complex outermembrane receptor protein
MAIARSLGIQLVILATLPAPLCWGQEGKGGDTLSYEIEQVVVVATRAQARMIDIPYSVFRVDKKELSFGKKVSAKDVLADVPGLFLQSRYGNHDLRISLRGFGTRSNSGARGVRILQDGIPESEPDGETVVDAIDFTSLGGVEVVKGNLSSLYANAPGGVVNFLSDLYFMRSYFSSMNQVGRFNMRENGFKLGLQNGANRILFTYNYFHLPGFRVHSEEFEHLGNLSYEGYIGESSTLNVFGNFVNAINRLPGSLTKSEWENDPFQANPLAVSQDFKRITQKGRIAVRYFTRFGESNSNELELTGYGGLKDLERADNESYSFATRRSLGALVRFTNRSRLMRHPNTLTFGMDYAHQAGPVTEFENISGVRGISVQNEYNESLNNIGFYVFDQFGVLEEKLDLFVSSRYDRNVFTRDIRIPFGFKDTVRTFAQLTPKIGLNYKFAPSVALYTSYGLSYEFPALSELPNTPLSSNIRYSLNPDLNLQQSLNFEVGVKGNFINPSSEFMRKLFIDIAFFHFVVRDEIVPFSISQKTYFRNAAKTRRTGIEVGIKSEPFEGIELTTNYTFTHFRYAEYATTIYTPVGPIHEDYTGNTVPSVPGHILNLILNYEYEISDDVSGLAQWDCDYISRMYVDDANTESSAGYFYGNMLAGINLTLADINATAYVGVNNIFDKRYVGFININEFYGRYYETGEPRTSYAGLKLSYKL